MYFKEPFDKEKIEKQHEELLNIFKEDLSNLSDKTIKKHIQNVDFFINEYLLNRNNANYEEVNNEVDLFFRDFFIRKCMWSSPNSIKETAARFKKFYKSMMNHDKFKKDDYKCLCDTIKDEMKSWQESCDYYDSGKMRRNFKRRVKRT